MRRRLWGLLAAAGLASCLLPKYSVDAVDAQAGSAGSSNTAGRGDSGGRDGSAAGNASAGASEHGGNAAVGDAGSAENAGSAGKVEPCSASQKRCSGQCVERSDVTYGCGATSCDQSDCPISTGAVLGCNASTCIITSCGAGSKPCDGACVAINDPTYGCGTTSCTADCPDPNLGTVVCSGNSCVLGACKGDTKACNGKCVPTDANNGCAAASCTPCDASLACVGSPTVCGGTNVVGVAGHPDQSLTYPKYPNFTLALAEEFNAPLNLRTDPVWTYGDGGLSGVARFTEAGISFADGKMKITVDKTSVEASTSFSENGADAPAMALRSGELRTKHNNYRYGRYEARIKAPKPVPSDAMQGNFISELLSFRTPISEERRELEFFIIGGGPNKLITNYAFYPNPGSVGFNSQFERSKNEAVTDTMAAFHDYAFEWTNDSIKWFVDGALLRTATPTSSGGPGAPLAIPDRSAKIMMNLWVFGSADLGGPSPGSNVYPFSIEYEWFRFYKLKGENYPCSPAPACLLPEDKNRSRNNSTETDTLAD